MLVSSTSSEVPIHRERNRERYVIDEIESFFKTELMDAGALRQRRLDLSAVGYVQAN
jgi:hypothetical protein